MYSLLTLYSHCLLFGIVNVHMTFGTFNSIHCYPLYFMHWVNYVLEVSLSLSPLSLPSLSLLPIALSSPHRTYTHIFFLPEFSKDQGGEVKEPAEGVRSTAAVQTASPGSHRQLALVSSTCKHQNSYSWGELGGAGLNEAHELRLKTAGIQQLHKPLCTSCRLPC